ncbi:MAG: FAD-dependent oxidoreductase [Candidatus Kapaibacteriota bacterium]|jgi:hypothetical protein
MNEPYDKIIIGAGLYGLYAALECGKKGEKVVVLEYDEAPFMRATYINQARVHMGYHYPRSYTTAKKSADYYDKFIEDYGFCINKEFTKIYAISNNFSWTNAKQFEKFCNDAAIPCKPINIDEYFKKNQCEGAYISKECTYDATLLKNHLLEQISKYSTIEICCNVRIESIKEIDKQYCIQTKEGQIFQSNFVLNSTYSSVNQIINLLNLDKIKIKYELCEVILCKVSSKLEDIGITVMDGPFFSLMPFGKTGYHSLTSVHHTPHKTSFSSLPKFDCQLNSQGSCSPVQLSNCNTCVAKPQSSWQYMLSLAKKYLTDDIEIEYVQSLFSIKPILVESELDDSRPTVIKVHTKKPTFVSVLSGKINTVYDLNDIL